MEIIKKFWSWLTMAESKPQKCCLGSSTSLTVCQCGITPVTPRESVTEFYKNDEGYAKAAYEDSVSVSDVPVVTPKKTRKPRVPKTPSTSKK